MVLTDLFTDFSKLGINLWAWGIKDSKVRIGQTVRTLALMSK